MFKKILIANRGEIACRVIKTAKAMGIETVAVYSDADARAPFVQMADEAVHIGPPPAGESYLVAEKIIAACKQTGAEAVHPGYGFLSERASFVEALEKENITFIGPPASAIAAMGDKIESKKLAKEAGVNTVPGSEDAIDTTQEALKVSNEIGYPVMMKASAGGGGKGMRLAWNDKDVEEGFEATKREGLNSFGDDRVFIEKFIEDPRHIEIQVLGDKHGTVLYLNERECSIQRRHQKVVEEAPSPFVTPEMRRKMGEQAVALSKAVGYHSAGTVELIVSGADPTGESFYFLEMNTRLQVEHPVTEAITGIDLVEYMIRVAAGEKLPMSQEDIGIDGWSIETRIYAEDPYRGFLPSTGRLVRYDTPVEPWAGDLRGVDGVRFDSGVQEGGEVSIFYDPMIAKLITWGETRDEAADLQVKALDGVELTGLGHNVDFLSALMQHERFRSGNLTTGFIAEEYPEGFAGAATSEERIRTVAAIAARIEFTHQQRQRQISGQLDGPQPVTPAWIVRVDGVDHTVTLGEESVVIDGHEIALKCDWTPGARTATAVQPGGPVLGLRITRLRPNWEINTHGRSYTARCLPARIAPLADHMIEKEPPDTSKMLLCPMPGLLVKLHVGEGDAVESGQPLATVEAMKMENILRAEKSGTVASVNFDEGETLMVDAVILELE
ncbi:acetyl-CoA carboxylase biotin carboxylase subunit [Aurantiacibacter poecillastricola]|uniref:acetyl-CoA carboxylase biotin carboxylase subunit n=1 Tax=Aurantiacibacter poecillastricola TaxID=3064385 RepID=UPI00273ECE3B|nr:acetyl/propionyl/methylcrotonyl-CoA carboxylase subunit alpha [Aurantiacibacter sp. 219JJ12-13]MDP5262661.1 acetyl/propionyl/methylcrotonyl-CoA carboxylase subunit alpha [Aurantiacibacter sp. 219JJ12-13]